MKELLDGGRSEKGDRPTEELHPASTLSTVQETLAARPESIDGGLSQSGGRADRSDGANTPIQQGASVKPAPSLERLPVWEQCRPRPRMPLWS